VRKSIFDFFNLNFAKKPMLKKIPPPLYSYLTRCVTEVCFLFSSSPMLQLDVMAFGKKRAIPFPAI
jgi:hypothetical protein